MEHIDYKECVMMKVNPSNENRLQSGLTRNENQIKTMIYNSKKNPH